MTDLHARLLAEIERHTTRTPRTSFGNCPQCGERADRDSAIEYTSLDGTYVHIFHRVGSHVFWPDNDGYDAAVDAIMGPPVLPPEWGALREIANLHTSLGGGCRECEYDWPCETVRAVAAAVGVDVADS